VKVIKKPEEWQPRQVTCGNCNAVLEVEVDDLRKQCHDGDLRDPPYAEVFVTCPECQRRVSINGVPKWQEEKIRNASDTGWQGR
jgi:uncharacterized protein YlaI